MYRLFSRGHFDVSLTRLAEVDDNGTRALDWVEIAYSSGDECFISKEWCRAKDLEEVERFCDRFELKLNGNV